MPSFSGFTDINSRPVPVPASFFTRLMPGIESLAELKVTLYVIWNLSQQEGDHRYVTLDDLTADITLLECLGENPALELGTAMDKAVERGSILMGVVPGQNREEKVYFLNSPRGQAALKAMQDGNWTPDPRSHNLVSLAADRPNIFKLYEENIGPLTPMISDTLKAAEADYSPEWIEDAIRIAVEKNVRNWRYIDAILRAWQEKGRNEVDRRNHEENRGRYIEGEYADLIQH